MSAWTPEVGDLFTVKCLRKMLVTVEGIEKFVPDRSWIDRVFRLAAKDSTHLVATVAFSRYGDRRDERVLLQLAEFNCMPVGPDIAKALGLDSTEST